MSLQDRYIRVEGHRIHYIEAGKASPPLILLHGGGSDCARLSWAPILPELAGSFRVLAPDLPGFGESDTIPLNRPIEDTARYLNHFLERVGVRVCHLAGLSMGGAIALSLYFRRPSRVQSLTLLASYGLGNYLPGGWAAYLAAHWPLLQKVVRRWLTTSPAFLRRSLTNVLFDPRHITPQLINDLRRHLKDHPTGTAWHRFVRYEVTRRGLHTVFSPEALSRIRVPTLLIHGREDRLIPHTFSDTAARHIPGAQYRLLPRCGHWIPREQPQMLARTLKTFLETISR